MAPRSQPNTGYAKDAVEVENYARSFGRRRPDVALTILRFANFIGPQIETPLTRYFSLPAVPTALGFDPRLQFLHEDDAVELLYRATREDHPGTYNASGDGVIYLSQAIRLAGKVPMPIATPFIGWIAALVRQTGLIDFSPEQVRFLMYGRVGNVKRLKESFAWVPTHTTLEAYKDFVAKRKIARVFTPEQAAQWEKDVYDFLARRSRRAALEAETVKA
jgi:UDP-glucose 4-epimerase